MTREECKNILVDHINASGGRREDELVAWAALYIIEGFSETFHPDMVSELLMEHRIAAINYTLPNQIMLNFLLPRDTKIALINIR